MPEYIVLDTDIVIDYLRGDQQAVDYLEALAKRSDVRLAVSVVTVAELYVGVRDAERARLARFLEALDVIALTGDHARAGGLFRRRYGPSHGTDLPDALIAATAEAERAVLVTFNVRHFPMLAEVRAPYERA